MLTLLEGTIMETHRIRSAKSTDKKTQPHVFLEIEKDTWLEVMPAFDHCSIHKLLADEKRKGIHYIRFASRAFHIGLINNWDEAGYIS